MNKKHPGSLVKKVIYMSKDFSDWMDETEMTPHKVRQIFDNYMKEHRNTGLVPVILNVTPRNRVYIERRQTLAENAIELWAHQKIMEEKEMYSIKPKEESTGEPIIEPQTKPEEGKKEISDKDIELLNEMAREVLQEVRWEQDGY